MPPSQKQTLQTSLAIVKRFIWKHTIYQLGTIFGGGDLASTACSLIQREDQYQDLILEKLCLEENKLSEAVVFIFKQKLRI